MPIVDTLLSGQLLFAALVTGALYALVALGVNLVYGTMRLLNVAHGDVLMLGAYGSFWALALWDVSPLAAAPLVAAAGAALGVAFYYGLFRGLLERAAADPVRLESNSLMLFFGLSIVIQNAAAIAFTPNVRAVQYLDSVYRIGGIAMTGNRIATLAIAGGVCIAATLFLRWSALGLSLRAVIERREAAQVVGVDVGRVQWFAFALGFGSAALAGVLLSMLEQFSPFAGFPFTIAAFIVVILGGLGNVLAGMVAALLLGAIETYGVALTSPNLRSVLLYGLFVAALLLFPQGLLARRAAR